MCVCNDVSGVMQYIRYVGVEIFFVVVERAYVIVVEYPYIMEIERDYVMVVENHYILQGMISID